MSRLSKQIRAYVDDPESTGKLHYGAWGILRPDQRRLIRQLCDECDAFEKDADKLYSRAEDVAREIIACIMTNHTTDIDGFFNMHKDELYAILKKYESEGADE